MYTKDLTKVFIAFILIVLFFCINTSKANASTKSDLSLAKSWIKSHYSEPIKVVNENKVPSNRIGTVYIEKIKTKSKGGYEGRTIKGNYYIKYPKKVKKGKKITVYCIWNPYNNACDDVVAVVCCGKVK